MSRVLFLKGGSAFSEFRINKLLEGGAELGIHEARAEHRYFVELDAELSAADLAFLCELLRAEPHEIGRASCRERV